MMGGVTDEIPMLERARLATIARRYFLEQRSKVEIAEEFGLSRFRVARMLELARELGIVTIWIEDTALIDDALSASLTQHCGLRRAVVVNGEPDDESLRGRIGEAGAGVLTEVLKAGDVLGLAWGRTLTALIEALPRLPEVSIVQLTGAVGANLHDSPVELVRKAALNAGGPAHPIFAPLLVDSATTANALRQQPDVAVAHKLFDSIDIAVVAVGSWDPPISQVRNAFRADERDDLLRRGVRAEVAATFVTDAGEIIGEDYVERCIAITAEQLRGIPEVIAVAGGAQKAKAIHAVIAAGLITSLVTDADVARYLLAQPAPAISRHTRRRTR
jgi:DNA-binding transcriptional regulator LsrR (DeoR family)